MTTVTTLIYMKNIFITNYADYADFQWQMRNNFITNYPDYADLKDYMQNGFITN